MLGSWIRYSFANLGRFWVVDQTTPISCQTLPSLCLVVNTPTSTQTLSHTSIHLSERQAGPRVALHVEPLRHDVMVPETRDVEQLAGLQHGLEGRSVSEALRPFPEQEGKEGKGRVNTRENTCCESLDHKYHASTPSLDFGDGAHKVQIRQTPKPIEASQVSNLIIVRRHQQPISSATKKPNRLSNRSPIPTTRLICKPRKQPTLDSVAQNQPPTSSATKKPNPQKKICHPLKPITHLICNQQTPTPTPTQPQPNPTIPAPSPLASPLRRTSPPPSAGRTGVPSR